MLPLPGSIGRLDWRNTAWGEHAVGETTSLKAIAAEIAKLALDRLKFTSYAHFAHATYVTLGLER